jgi:hypothetical protein
MELLSTSSNLLIKKGIAESLSIHDKSFPFQVDLTIHDIPFRFYVSEERVIDQLYGLYPLNWFHAHKQPPFEIYWMNNTDLGLTDIQWENEEDYECVLHQSGARNIALQRDFVGIEEGIHTILVCPYDIGDGFYNFLRWIAPKYFLKTHKMLLHSSCVLDGNKNAYFCFGPSGAGKTTIASLASRRRVLGDDMNVIKVHAGKCWAQAGALGQAITNPNEYTHWYPVKGMLWLEKSEKLEIKPISKSEQAMKLSSAVANVFWPQLSNMQIQQILISVQSILQVSEMKLLKFPIKREVWPFVWESFHDSQEKFNEI